MAYKSPDVQDVIPNLTFKDSKAAIEFYKEALGITNIDTMTMDDGTVMHGHFKLGDTTIFFNDEMQMSPRKAPTGPTAVAFYVYVPDVDKSHQQAVTAGMTEDFAPADMFWGDRTSVATDPFNYTWTFSTHTHDPTPEEMEEAQRKMFGGGDT